MKAKFRRLTTVVFLSFLAVLAIWSCSKKPETIGLELLDYNKPFVGKDTTFHVSAYSTVEDSVISDETSVNLLGTMYSEIFGKVKASIYTQLRISALNPEWGSNPVADSVVFTMVYDGYYGNLETEQTVRVYRILEDFYRDSTYYSNVSFETAMEELGSLTFIPNLDTILVVDSTDGEVDSSYMNPSLRIPFDNAFADYIFNLDTAYTSSSEAFLEEFKGICLRTDDVASAGDGAILYFDLLDDLSNLTIYYHNDSADSLGFRFLINLNNARVGRYEHEYLLGEQDFIEQVINGDTSRGTEKLYLQGLAGVKTKIRFPGVAEWAESSTKVINEAKLVINLAENYDDDHAPATSLILLKNTEQGTFVFLPDQLEGEGYFGGVYDKGDNSYAFRISMHLQKLLTGEKDYGVTLFPTAKSIKATEMIFNGTNLEIPRRFQLQVTYTEVD